MCFLEVSFKESGASLPFWKESSKAILKVRYLQSYKFVDFQTWKPPLPGSSSFTPISTHLSRRNLQFPWSWHWRCGSLESTVHCNFSLEISLQMIQNKHVDAKLNRSCRRERCWKINVFHYSHPKKLLDSVEFLKTGNQQMYPKCSRHRCFSLNSHQTNQSWTPTPTPSIKDFIGRESSWDIKEWQNVGQV